MSHVKLFLTCPRTYDTWIHVQENDIYQLVQPKSKANRLNRPMNYMYTEMELFQSV